MEDNVRKELDTLEQMVLNWKRSYLSMATPEGGDEYLAEEFQSEVTEYVSPHVRRLFECNHLTPEEFGEFLERCHDHVQDLRETLKGPEPEPPPERVWQRVVKLTRIFRPG
jgi:hypothetical protein